MTVPVLLVTGFLGAGKTTVINQILAQAEGRRIAALVNDFGAINIDAELIVGASDGVISLANGCICCSLEGDLLRSIAGVLRRDPRPDTIVIETSGVADPADIVRNLMDPIVFREAPLETVLCVVDADSPTETLADSLFRAQVRAADVVALSKVDLAEPDGLATVRRKVAAIKPTAVTTEAAWGRLPAELLFSPDPDRERTRDPLPPGRHAERFETLSWTSDEPISLGRLQRAIGQLAPRLARAKGFFETPEEPGRPMLFQLAGGRATLAPGPTRPPGLPRVRLVFIAEIGALPIEEIRDAMTVCSPAKAAGDRLREVEGGP